MIAKPVFHNQTADQSIGGRLQPLFNGYLNPADDLVGEACNECGLLLRTISKRLNPTYDLLGWTLITKLFDQNANLGRVVRLDRANHDLRRILDQGNNHECHFPASGPIFEALC